MNKRPSSILSVLLAMGGLGATGPSLRKASEKKRHNWNPFRDVDERQNVRLAKRAEKDLRAARMNYAGWCGRPESGELRAT